MIELTWGLEIDVLVQQHRPGSASCPLAAAVLDAHQVVSLQVFSVHPVRSDQERFSRPGVATRSPGCREELLGAGTVTRVANLAAGLPSPLALPPGPSSPISSPLTPPALDLLRDSPDGLPIREASISRRAQKSRSRMP